MSMVYCNMPDCQRSAHEVYEGTRFCYNCMSAYIRGRNEQHVDDLKRRDIKEAERANRYTSRYHRGD